MSKSKFEVSFFKAIFQEPCVCLFILYHGLYFEDDNSTVLGSTTLFCTNSQYNILVQDFQVHRTYVVMHYYCIATAILLP